MLVTPKRLQDFEMIDVHIDHAFFALSLHEIEIQYMMSLFPPSSFDEVLRSSTQIYSLSQQSEFCSTHLRSRKMNDLAEIDEYRKYSLQHA